MLLAAVATAAPPVRISLTDAISRARQFSPQLQAAVEASGLALQDRVQAKSALLPSASYLNQYVYTKGNGTSSGVFVANDGVHIYNSQGVVHQDFSVAKNLDYRRTEAALALAKAREDVAARGLVATVVQNYYAVAAAVRKAGNAGQSLEEARQFLDITSKQERGGEVAHADVVKASLLVRQRERDGEDAKLAASKARLMLGVLLFADFQQDFDVVDDLAEVPPLGPLADVQTQGALKNPDIRAAQAAVEQEKFGVSSARSGYLPVVSLDLFYGIDANVFSIRGPNERKNLGFSAQGSLLIPLWNWGATRSRIEQASLRERQAKLELTAAQKQLMANLQAFYMEAQAARSQIESLGDSRDLAQESLRLTLLRYQAGEATALEVSDAETTVAQGRNAYADGLARYRLALAAMQTLTGAL